MKYMVLFLSLAFSYSAVATSKVVPYDSAEPNFMDSDAYDPADPNINKVLEAYDQYYETLTGKSPHLPGSGDLLSRISGCYRDSCIVWAHVSKKDQRLYLYINGVHQGTWKTSTGLGNLTPNFDRPPNGRIYDAYSSKKHPGGDYKGLGNMPYAVFIEGGYAIHGTPKANWKHLGRKASHGCIRIHPDYAEYFNQVVREFGIDNVWITVN
jgi:hypothetical protein